MRNNNAVALTSRITERANRLIVRELEARGVKGIVPSHGGILGLLFAGERYTMQELAEKIHRTKPTVTVLVDKLVQLGYVVKEKSREDNRVTFLRLTAQGQALQPLFEAVSEALNRTVYRGLSEIEAEQLELLLQKVKNNLN